MKKVTNRQYHDETNANNDALTNYLMQPSLFVNKGLMMQIILQKTLLTFLTLSFFVCIT